MRACALLVVAACHEPLSYSIATGPRDWTAHPAIVELPAGTIYAASDIHGGYARFVALLARYGVIDGVPATPLDARWLGGDATLVVVGDLFDKGPDGLDVIDLLRTLQSSGGQVVVVLGNHEAEFFA